VAALAWGNIVPADHGRTLDAEEALGEMPPARLARRAADAGPRVLEPGMPEACLPCPPVLLPARWEPVLAEAPVARVVAHDRGRSARAFLEADPTLAEPAILALAGLRDDGTRETWGLVPDLLRSGDARHAVAETGEDGRVRLRFGRDGHGRSPAAHTGFRVLYRVGGGPEGNVGAEALAHLATGDALLLARDEGTIRVRNPLPAGGGTAPETVEAVRRRAPHAFAAVQHRAVTLADHEARAREHGGVQQAAARLRWSGSWHNLCLAADRVGGLALDDDFAGSLAVHMRGVRLMGQGLTIERPVEVAVDLEVEVVLEDGQSRAEMRRALVAAVAAAFDPDRLTFGQAVHLSPVVAALQAVDGVRFLRVLRFERRDAPGPEGMAEGALRFGRREVPRLSDDPNHPEHGSFTLVLRGGR
jgi:predicted phage baseplate assembly protein